MKVQISYLLEIHTQVFLLLWLWTRFDVSVSCVMNLKINLYIHEKKKNIFTIVAVRQFITYWINMGM